MHGGMPLRLYRYGMMKTLKDLLRDKKGSIVERWLKDILSVYSPETCSFLNRRKDRFTNPVGHALRVGTQTILEGLIEGMETDSICRHLDDIIRSRAIQDFSPSQAVSFVFNLKKVVRLELGEEAKDPQLYAGLIKFEADVDQVALFAFDIYTRCREQVQELRVNEMKRSVAAIMKRFNSSIPEPTSVLDRSETKPRYSN